MRLVLLCLLISFFQPCFSQEEKLSFWLLCQKGASYLMSGEYTNAETAYKSALSCAYDEDDIEKVHINLANIYTITGRLNEAKKELLLCSDENLLAKVHLSNVYLRMAEYENSLLCLNEVIAHSPQNSQLYSIAHQNVGYVYWQTRNYEKAKEEMEVALPNLSGNVKSASLGNYALILAKLGQFQKALQTIDEAISLTDTNSEDYTILLRKKAEILLLSNNKQDSYVNFKKFFEKEKTYVLSNFSSMTEQNRLDFWKTLKPNISKIFALENDCPDFLLDVALFRREVALLGDVDREEMNRRLNVTGSMIRKALKTHEVAIDFVRYEEGDTTRYGAIIIPSMKTRKLVRFIPLWTEEELHGYNIRNNCRLDSALCYSCLTDKDEVYTDSLLNNLVWNKLNTILESYDYEDVYFAPDGILHLFAIEYLRGDNGVFLHRLTSLTNLIKRSKHLISNKSKMLAAGGFDYDAESCEPNEQNSVSNHDAMDFLQKKLKHVEHPFTYLEDAKVEIDSITEITPFEITSANVKSEKQLKNDINNKEYNILHLSTHGYALDVEVPFIPEALRDSITEDKSLLASGIALTGANVAYKNQRQEDGIISAREFCEMDMSHIDLMVLSACQTGLGRFNDEGPAGLVRGLKKAGAGALIVSLWNVSDEATMLFMKHLYKAMSEQNSIDIHAAFNTARLNFSLETKDVRRFNSKRMKTDRYKESYNLPRYCNSFILIDAIN